MHESNNLLSLFWMSMKLNLIYFCSFFFKILTNFIFFWKSSYLNEVINLGKVKNWRKLFIKQKQKDINSASSTLKIMPVTFASDENIFIKYVSNHKL